MLTGAFALAGGVGALPAFGPFSVVTASRPAPLATAVLLLTGGVYLLGVHRLRAQGHPWQRRRTVCFVGLGLGTVAIALLSGLATYDTVLFGPHMVQHMLLAMVAPVFLALGAPITLALRTLPARPRRWLLVVLHSRLAKVLTFPLVPWLLFVGSPFALYFSGWYPATLDHPLLHTLLHLHFLLVGSLFFWPMLGLDPVPGRVSHPLRMLIIFATLPFHAFLGIAIMSVPASGSALIGARHYLALRDRAGVAFQQQLAGGLLWASGDLIGLLFLGVLLTQWMRASEREAAREDRRLDRAEALAGSSRPR